MGRSKYLTPVYSALQDSGQHDLAVQWNNENKDFYHPVAEASVMKIIGSDAKVEEFSFESLIDELADEFDMIYDLTQQAMFLN